MKLETFNADNLRNKRVFIPQISISTKTGSINFNAGATEKLNLKVGDQIQLLHDQEQPGDWYVEIVKKDGFVLRGKKNPNGTFNCLITQSCKLAKKIFESVDCKKASGQIGIAEKAIQFEKRTMWPLITAKLLKTSI